MKSRCSFLLIAAGFLLAPALASAHVLPGDPHGFHEGFQHPFTGWDHLLAMLAVGLWAAQQKGQSVWLIPATFVSVMVFGGMAGLLGANLPGSEWVIALSLTVFGLLIAASVRFSPGWSMLLVGCFAFFHGFAHGLEMPASLGAGPFTLGFVAATLLLHGLGLAAGSTLERNRGGEWLRFAGLAIALGPLYL